MTVVGDDARGAVRLAVFFSSKPDERVRKIPKRRFSDASLSTSEAAQNSSITPTSFRTERLRVQHVRLPEPTEQADAHQIVQLVADDAYRPAGEHDDSDFRSRQPCSRGSLPSPLTTMPSCVPRTTRLSIVEVDAPSRRTPVWKLRTLPFLIVTPVWLKASIPTPSPAGPGNRVAVQIDGDAARADRDSGGAAVSDRSRVTFSVATFAAGERAVRRARDRRECRSRPRRRATATERLSTRRRTTSPWTTIRPDRRMSGHFT